MAGALGFGLLIALLLSMFLIIASDEDSGGSGSGLYIGVNLSAEVLAHQPMVEKYARQNGISDYVYVLLAIIQVESEGKLEDVMQSSESAGLPLLKKSVMRHLTAVQSWNYLLIPVWKKSDRMHF